MVKLIKNNLGNFLAILLIFLMLAGWIFSGWPRIWQNPQIPPEVQEAYAAAPIVESVTETESGGTVTTFTMNMPATRPDGDLYIAVVGKDDDVVISGVPANWTEIYNFTDGANGCSLGAWWWKGSSEPATYDVTGDSEEYSGAILRISGADTTSPIHTSGTGTGDSNSPTAPTVTPTIADTIILYTAAIDTATWDTTDPYPSGTTGQFAINSTSGGNGSGNTAGATKAGVKDSASGTGAFLAQAADTWAAGTIAIAPAAAGYLYFSVTGNETLPNLTPGTVVATTSILQVRTDSANGFNITVERDDSDTTMDLDTDAAINIPDKTEWIAPTATTTAGNATASTTEPQTLQFRVRQSGTDTPNYASVWWGTDDTTANALFAGFASSTAPTANKRIIDRSTAATASTTSYVLYNLDVSTSQKQGTYSGSITYTATANP